MTADPMQRARERVQRYVDMRDQMPMRQLGDSVHGIHSGTEWEAELLLSDLRALLTREEEVRGEGWRPMSEAPRDGSYILAIVAPNRGRYLEHHAGRVFVIRHEGLTEPSGYDLGWAVYPGLGGASDHDFTHWRPLPAPPAIRSANCGGGGK